MRNSFEDGKRAGQKLLTLFADLGQAFELKPVPLETVEQLLQEVWSWSSKSKPSDVVVGFFSQILPADGYSSRVLNVWGADEFLLSQEDLAPVCNIPRDAGIFGFADWTGLSDGDTWCYDVKYERVRCLPVSSGDGDADQSRLYSYGVSSDFHQLASYLRSEAELRNWISA